MKIVIIVFFLSLPIFNIFSQGVSIQLSIEWKSEEQIICNDSSTQCYPYLNITYKNKTTIPIYFMKPCVNEYGLKKLSNSSKKIGKWSYKKKFNPNYSTNNYKVVMGNSPYYLLGWEVIQDTIDISKEYENDLINNDISSIYEIIFPKSILNPSYIEYKSKDINQSGILKKFQNNFCFLKTGETITESYNLIGFQIVKGSFNFQFYKDSLFNYVYSDSYWVKKNNQWIDKKVIITFEISFNTHFLFHLEGYPSCCSP